MYRAFAVLLLFTMICSNIGCSHRQRLRDEASLRESLFSLRTLIDQFTRDHQRRPTSLSELASGGYIKQIPIDPFTGKNDTWRIEKTDEHIEIHSGSDGISSEGTPYVVTELLNVNRRGLKKEPKQ